MVFDYIDGGVDDEVMLWDNFGWFVNYKLNFKMLVDIFEIDMCILVMGVESIVLIVVILMAVQCFFYFKGGESVVVWVVKKVGLIYCFFMFGLMIIECVVELIDGLKWFQVFVWKDWVIVEKVFECVWVVGFIGVILIVDVFVVGNCECDYVNVFIILLKINVRMVSQVFV